MIVNKAPSACNLIGGSSSKTFTSFLLSGIEKFSGTLFTVIFTYAYVDWFVPPAVVLLTYPYTWNVPTWVGVPVIVFLSADQLKPRGRSPPTELTLAFAGILRVIGAISLPAVNV